MHARPAELWTRSKFVPVVSTVSKTAILGLRGDDGEEDCLRHSNTEKLGRITRQYEYAGPRTVGLADCCSCRPRNWLCSPQTAQTERSTIMIVCTAGGTIDSQQICPRGRVDAGLRGGVHETAC